MKYSAFLFGHSDSMFPDLVWTVFVFSNNYKSGSKGIIECKFYEKIHILIFNLNTSYIMWYWGYTCSDA